MLRRRYRRHFPEPGLLEPFAILAHREDVARRCIDQHVEAEQERPRRSAALVIGHEFADQQHSAVGKRLTGPLEQALAPVGALAMDDMA